ncbi:conjugal transfer protein MobA [Dysgonomonas termitidis]|uniref:Conjugal transfer protein MobA n=1 Tax=Dysgonomonas termitidis TaxID=1516126 RepID=A0ABV9KYC9_9BACT
MGRKTAKDPAIHKVNFRMNSSDYERLMRMFRESEQKNLSLFIISVMLNREMKVVKVDKSTMDYYMRLTTFYTQYQAVGNNYNQLVKAIKSNFGEKRGLAMLYRLEKTTIELISITKQLFALTDEFEKKYLAKKE